jgi:hypothetical protein
VALVLVTAVWAPCPSADGIELHGEDQPQMALAVTRLLHLELHRVRRGVGPRFEGQRVRALREALQAQVEDVAIACKPELVVGVGVSRVLQRARCVRRHQVDRRRHDRHRGNGDICAGSIAELRLDRNRAAPLMGLGLVEEHALAVRHAVRDTRVVVLPTASVAATENVWEPTVLVLIGPPFATGPTHDATPDPPSVHE